MSQVYVPVLGAWSVSIHYMKDWMIVKEAKIDQNILKEAQVSDSKDEKQELYRGRGAEIQKINIHIFVSLLGC